MEKIKTKKSAEEYYKQYPGYKNPIYDVNFFLNKILKKRFT